MTPQQILALFNKHWTGTEEELDEALEAFYRDIANSLERALEISWPVSGRRAAKQQGAVLATLTDYVANHYLF